MKWASWWTTPLSLDARLFTFSDKDAVQFLRNRLSRVGIPSDLKLGLRSFRAGGCVNDFLRFRDYQLVFDKGRWLDIRTMK